MSRASVFLMGAVLALGVAAVHAQAPLNLDGEWVTRVKAVNGNEYDSTLRLNGETGIYQFSLRNTGDPCLGLPTPVQWRSTAEGIDITFQVSKALTGCADSTVPFRRVDDNTWQGRSQRGTEFTLRRKATG